MEDNYDMKHEKLQLADSEEDDEDADNGDNADVNNQDDDQDMNGEPTQPSAAMPAQPNNNVDQNRGLPGISSPENLPPPDYSAVNMRGLALL